MPDRPSPPTQDQQAPSAESRGPTDGRKVTWLLAGAFLVCIGASFFQASDHLIQQRLSEVEGHLALVGLALTLTARPLNRFLPGLLQERRYLGLLTFAFSVLHTWSQIEHVLGGSLDGMFFLPRDMQFGVELGIFALLAMLPLALTSTDWAVRTLKGAWKGLHQGVFFAAFLIVLHTLGTGVHYPLVAQTPLTFAFGLALLGGVLWVWRLRSRADNSGKAEP
ncbi:ferric reductase-like transmembrane domain-containing protein [Gloeobacter violaceus]|uniref:Gll3557 protein n=1 Tax=Gloeobacter violaceus (strain ATCC 29082 / PCC 7421) TaxID=251221 RepID=Q7NFG8_GLOVI|nr:ferric reductase-like transmembrane domain-containing protein [Gloeobacter violaceus]BAC91498.1 gll3557 [Gloeobacter violaceus PCC 7421]